MTKTQLTNPLWYVDYSLQVNVARGHPGHIAIPEVLDSRTGRAADGNGCDVSEEILGPRMNERN